MIPYAVIGLWNVAKKLQEKDNSRLNIAPSVSSIVILISVVITLVAGKELSIIQSGNSAYQAYLERFRKSALSPLPEGPYYLNNCSDNSGLIVSTGGNFALVTCSDELPPAVIEVQNYGYQTRFRNKETGYYIKRYEFNDSTLILQLESMAGGVASWLLDCISDNEYIIKDESDYVLTLDLENGNLLMAPYLGENNQIWKFTECSR